MNKKTKVIPSSPSNPCCEKILIEKLKELTLSSKNESAQKRMQ